MFTTHKQTITKNFLKLFSAFVFLSAFISPVSASAATLYFCGGTSGNWNTLSNWKTDSGCSSAASAIPTSSDDVIVLKGIDSNSGPAITINTFTVDTSTGNQVFSSIDFTVLNSATFSDTQYGSGSNSGTITGNVTFNDTTYNSGTINGNVTFNNTSQNAYGTITGDVVFSNESYNNQSVITGDVTFNGSSYNTQSTITGNVTFNTDAVNPANTDGLISGTATFYGSSRNDGDITGTAIFYETSSNEYGNGYDLVTGTIEFHDNSYNDDVLGGDVYVFYPSANPIGGDVSGANSVTYLEYPRNLRFDGGSIGNETDWGDLANWYDIDLSAAAQSLPGSYDNVTINYASYGVTTNSLGVTPEVANLTVQDTGPGSVVFGIDINVSGDVVFSGAAFQNSASTITASTITFTDSSYFEGTLNGDVYIGSTDYYAGGSPGSSGVYHVDVNNWKGTVNGSLYFGVGDPVNLLVFGGSTVNEGGVSTSTAVQFDDTSYNAGTIMGDVTLNTSYYTYGATNIAGNFYVTQNYFSGNISGALYGPDNNPITNIIFSDGTYNNALFTSNATFNGSSYNGGTITGNATFVGDSSYSNGAITGTKTRLYTSSLTTTRNFISDGTSLVIADGSGVVVDVSGTTYNHLTTFSEQNGGTFSGYTQPDFTFIEGAYDGDWNNLDNWYDHNLAGGAVSLPTSGDDVILETSVTQNTGDPAVARTITINSINYIQISITVSDGATFNGSSSNGGEIIGTATFNNTSYNSTSVIGDAYFHTTHYSDGNLDGSGNFYITQDNWYGSISGTAYGPDNSPITDFFFSNSTYNYGTITGNATFIGDSSNNAGTITGDKTRLYTTSLTTTRNFVSDGTPIVIADGSGVVVDVSGASYDGSITFSGLNGGTFYGLPLAPRNLHFTGSVDDNWNNLDNWYDNDLGGPAESLPNSGDTVTLEADVNQNIGGDPVSVSVLISNGGNLFIPATISGYLDSGATVTGDVTFTGSGYNAGYVIGNATLNTTHYSDGTLDGSASFYVNQNNWLGQIDGTIYGPDNNPVSSLIFSNGMSNQGSVPGSVNNVSFSGGSYNDGIINGTATFHDSGTNEGTVYGSATFYDSSYNYYGVLASDAYFYTTHYSDGSLDGNGNFYITQDNWTGEVDGNLYGPDSQIITTLIFDGGNNEGNIFNTGVRFIGASYNNSAITNDNVTFYGSSINTGIIVGNVEFNDTSSNNGTITGNVTLSGDLSENGTGIISGAITRLYTTSLTTTRNFLSGNTSSIVADGSGVVVDVSGATYDGNTTFTELNGGNFVFRTLTFTGSTDHDWNNLDNWYDEGLAAPAAFLPTSNDNVVIENWIDQNNGDPAVAGTLSISGGGNTITIPLTVSNGATFSNGAGFENQTLTGDVTFETGSYSNDATIIGGVSYLSGSASNNTQITGAVTFTDSGFGGSTITGTTTFNGSASQYGGTINGNVFFNDSSSIYDEPIINGNATFNGDSSEFISGALTPTITGSKTRYYTTSTTTIRDFLTTGPWIVIADGASVNVVNAIYDGNTSFFELNEGSFTYLEVPTVITSAASSISTTTATLNGDITATGGANATVRGFNYGLSTSYTGTTTDSGSFGTGAYALGIESLTCNTLYYFRAFATNSVGTSYGSDVTFTTDACPGVTTHTLSYSAGAHGSLTGSTTQVVASGADGSSVTAVPDSGYVFSSWSDASTDNPRIDTNVSGGVTVTASFTAIPAARSSRSGGGNGGYVAPQSTLPTQVSATTQSILDFLRQLFSTNTTIIVPDSFVSTPSAPVSGTPRNLTLLSVGADVTALQSFLIEQSVGPEVRKLALRGTTGYFGVLTQAALAEYQKKNNIVPSSGYFGPITKAYLEKKGIAWWK